MKNKENNIENENKTDILTDKPQVEEQKIKIKKTKTDVNKKDIAVENENLHKEIQDIATSYVKKLEEELEMKKTALHEKEKEILYLRAEHDNTVKALRREITRTKDTAINGFAQSIIKIKEEMTNTIKTLDEKSGANILSMFESSLLNTLLKSGVIPMGTQVNDVFNAERHEITSTVPSNENIEKNTIASVISEGYLIKEIVLVPAIVVVAV